MTFSVLLIKNENYQQINYKEHYFMTNINGIIISVLQRKCTSTQGFRKAICVEIKTKTKNPRLGLLYSAKHLVCHALWQCHH